MGIRMDKRPIDRRLIEDDKFMEFFLDEDERLHRDIPAVVVLDGEDYTGNRMRDVAYVDQVYARYLKTKG